MYPIPERIYRAQVNGDLGMLSMRMFEKHWCGRMREGGPRMVLRGGNIHCRVKAWGEGEGGVRGSMPSIYVGLVLWGNLRSRCSRIITIPGVMLGFEWLS